MKLAAFHVSVAQADLDKHLIQFQLTLFWQVSNTYTLAISACGSNGFLTEYSNQAERLFNEDKQVQHLDFR